MRQKAALLPHRSVIQISGPDSEKFLSDLITNSLPDKEEAAFAGLLTPQGKILFDFLLIKTKEGFLLDIDAKLVNDCLKRLTMYKLRADVDLTNLSQKLDVYAIWGETENEKQPEDARTFPDPRFQPLGCRAFLEKNGKRDWNLVEQVDYEKHRIALAVPEGGKDYGYGENFPHDACYDNLNGVNFKKGCYVGQEVVSRMKHRGTARKRIVHITSDESLHNSESEIIADGMAIGKLGSRYENQGIGLVRIDRLANALKNGNHPTLNDKPIILSPPSWADYTIEQFA